MTSGMVLQKAPSMFFWEKRRGRETMSSFAEIFLLTWGDVRRKVGEKTVGVFWIALLNLTCEIARDE
jgi:hypothetical protein